MKMMIYLKVMFQLIQSEVNILFSTIFDDSFYFLDTSKGEKRKRVTTNQEENDDDDDDEPPHKI
jgi:hypothetical protein